MARTTDDLLKKIKKKSFIPTSQSTFTDEELLEIATEELHGVIVPTITNAREEYFVYKDDSNALTGSLNPVFDIPHRSVGMQLREITATIGNVENNLPRLDLEDRTYARSSSNVFGFDLTNNQINVRGSNSGTLNLYYYLRPGDLVKSNQARQIAVIDPDNRQLTVTSPPSSWNTATKFDVIKQLAGYGHKSIDMTISNIDSATGVITFTEDFPADGWTQFVVGDWLAVAEQSPVPQIPLEWQEYLAEAVVCYMMESIGDSEAFDRASARKNELKKLALDTISPRVDGQSKKQVPRRNRGAYIYDSWRNSW